MGDVKIEASVYTHDCDGNHLSEKTKTFDISVMKVGVVRQWVRRTFNAALRTAPAGVIVVGNYHGQLETSPFTFFHGRLGGTSGRLLSKSGEFDQ